MLTLISFYLKFEIFSRDECTTKNSVCKKNTFVFILQGFFQPCRYDNIFKTYKVEKNLAGKRI